MIRDRFYSSRAFQQAQKLPKRMRNEEVMTISIFEEKNRKGCSFSLFFSSQERREDIEEKIIFSLSLSRCHLTDAKMEIADKEREN